MTTAAKLLALGAVVTLGACVDSRPDVVFETELGSFTVEVDPDRAPASAGDFLRYVDSGLFDGQGFYRTVTPGVDPRGQGMSLVQGGRLDLLPQGGYVPHEPTGASGLSNTEGSVALARTEVGTGSAAFFFVNMDDNTMLDEGGDRNPDGAGYAVFGRVTDGMDTLRAIQSRPTARDPAGIFADGQKLERPVLIERAYRD